MPDAHAAALQRARTLVAQSAHITVLTGAGISTDSGIPDYRGPSGVWTRDPEAEKLVTLHYYMADPDIRRRAWRMRLASGIFEAEPNRGHRALCALQDAGKLVAVITQNIDGLHQRAGLPQTRVIELHGSARRVVCMACGAREPAEPTLQRVRDGEPDPACRACGGILKSDTIAFGQSLVAADLQRAEAAATGCDLLLAVGSSLSVYPAAGVVPRAQQAGARIVILNGEATAMDALADVVLHGTIGTLLPAIVAN